MSEEIIDLTHDNIAEFDPDEIYVSGDIVMYQGKMHVIRKSTMTRKTSVDQLIEIVRSPGGIKVCSTWTEAKPYKEGDLVLFNGEVCRIGECWSSTTPPLEMLQREQPVKEAKYLDEAEYLERVGNG